MDIAMEKPLFKGSVSLSSYCVGEREKQLFLYKCIVHLALKMAAIKLYMENVSIYKA